MKHNKDPTKQHSFFKLKKLYNMKNLTLILLIISLLFACKKETPKQFSNWKMDEQAYSSNNVTTSIGKAIANLDCWDKNRFGIRFYSFSVSHPNSLPDAGEFLLVKDNPSQNPNMVLLYLYIDTVGYAPSPSETKYLKAERVEGKIRYTLPPMWYVNYYNTDDSVFVEGIFNEP